MKSLLKQFRQAFKEAVAETRYIFSISEIKLADNIEQATLRYRLIGTGKVSLPVSLVKVFENENLLVKFKPRDIKIISTTVTLLRNPPDQYTVQAIHYQENNECMIEFKQLHGETIKLMPISKLNANSKLLNVTDKKSIFRLGFLQGLRVGQKRHKPD